MKIAPPLSIVRIQKTDKLQKEYRDGLESVLVNFFLLFLSKKRIIFLPSSDPAKFIKG